MTAATPGPWYVTAREGCLRIREEASDYTIATTDDGGHPELEVFDFDQQAANARLIAAAPHMAAAIRDFLYALDRGYLDCKDDSAFIDDLRAALAEATSARIAA